MFDTIREWLYNQPRKTKKLTLKMRLKNMTTKTEVNYTPEMVESMQAAAPLDYDKAIMLGAALGRPVRSIIAKAKREGIAYISKPAPAKKKPAGVTKTELLGMIAQSFEVNADELVGLEKATSASLNKLLGMINA